MSKQKTKKTFKVVIERVERYSHEEEIEAATMEEAVAKAEQMNDEGEFNSYWDCFDDEETTVRPADVPKPATLINWYNWEMLTDADHRKVSKDSANRHWGYSAADLLHEIADFKTAMEKADIHATSMICARLEDCNYHSVCGKLSEGDIDGALLAVAEIYAA